MYETLHWDQAATQTEEGLRPARLRSQPRPDFMRPCGWWEFKSCLTFLKVHVYHNGKLCKHAALPQHYSNKPARSDPALANVVALRCRLGSGMSRLWHVWLFPGCRGAEQWAGTIILGQYQRNLTFHSLELFVWVFKVKLHSCTVFVDFIAFGIWSTVWILVCLSALVSIQWWQTSADLQAVEKSYQPAVQDGFHPQSHSVHVASFGKKHQAKKHLKAPESRQQQVCTYHCYVHKDCRVSILPVIITGSYLPEEGGFYQLGNTNCSETECTRSGQGHTDMKTGKRGRELEKTIQTSGVVHCDHSQSRWQPARTANTQKGDCTTARKSWPWKESDIPLWKTVSLSRFFLQHIDWLNDPVMQHENERLQEKKQQHTLCLTNYAAVVFNPSCKIIGML